MSGFSNNEGSGSLKLAGSLTVENAEELYRAFLDAQKVVENLVVIVEDSTEIDLACLQLFFSAQKSFDQAKKDLVFRGSGTVIEKLIADTGVMKNDDELSGLNGLRWETE